MAFVIERHALIDLMQADKSLTRLASAELGPIHIPSVVLNEIRNTNQINCKRLGLSVVECSIEHLVDASHGNVGLSFRDSLTIIVARQLNWGCIVNDPVVSAACTKNCVAVLCGLDLIAELVRRLRLPCKRAIRAARALHHNNPRHVSKENIGQCENQIEDFCRQRKGR